jgi:hypothetical protein
VSFRAGTRRSVAGSGRFCRRCPSNTRITLPCSGLGTSPQTSTTGVVRSRTTKTAWSSPPSARGRPSPARRARAWLYRYSREFAG